MAEPLKDGYNQKFAVTIFNNDFVCNYSISSHVAIISSIDLCLHHLCHLFNSVPILLARQQSMDKSIRPP